MIHQTHLLRCSGTLHTVCPQMATSSPCPDVISDWTLRRLVHAFGLSAPSVLVQGYIMALAGTSSIGGASSTASEAASSTSQSSSSATAEDVERSLKIHVISSALSLFNICWGESDEGILIDDKDNMSRFVISSPLRSKKSKYTYFFVSLKACFLILQIW